MTVRRPRRRLRLIGIVLAILLAAITIGATLYVAVEGPAANRRYIDSQLELRSRARDAKDAAAKKTADTALVKAKSKQDRADAAVRAATRRDVCALLTQLPRSPATDPLRHDLGCGQATDPSPAPTGGPPSPSPAASPAPVAPGVSGPPSAVPPSSVSPSPRASAGGPPPRRSGSSPGPSGPAPSRSPEPVASPSPSASPSAAPSRPPLVCVLAVCVP